eukprot:5574082-Karenia_brevis.AAC.1
MVFRQRGSILIFDKKLEGTTATLDVDVSDTIINVEAMHAASIVWASATLCHASSELFDVIERVVKMHMKDKNSPEFAVTVWALAIASHATPAPVSYTHLTLPTICSV